MDNTYNKSEKLKARKTIEKLFTEGKSVSKYPLRLVYIETDSRDALPQLSVSVSKKYFKKAVDRNYFKRCLREAYRLNKQVLLRDLQGPHAFMLLYQSAERLSFAEINEKVILLFEKFTKQHNPLS